jgi:hypothetical protein
MNARRVAAAAVLPLVAACRSMQAVPVDFIPDTKPAVIYLSDGNGVTQAVANPRLSGDTVHGTTVVGNQPVAVPLSHVQRMTTVRLSRARTVLLVGGVATVGALVTYAMLVHSRGDASGFCDYDNQPMGAGAMECGYPSNP